MYYMHYLPLVAFDEVILGRLYSIQTNTVTRKTSEGIQSTASELDDVTVLY